VKANKVLIATMLLAPLAALLVALRWGRAVEAPVTLRASSPGAAAAAATAALPEPEKEPVPVVHGRILGADGNPVNGATVRAIAPSPSYVVYADTRSDAAGGFSFAHLGSERVRLEADHDADGSVTSAELHVIEGQSTEVTLVLATASVRGTVVDSADHAVAGAVLSVEGVPWAVGGATSDADGAFRLGCVPDGATSLVALARGYETARVSLPRRDEPVELVVRVRLVAGSPVQGDVHDPDGHPVRARVVACEGQPSEAGVTSAEDGTFELPPSTIGCGAVARHDEYGSSDAVTLVEGRRAELSLRAGGAIEGLVVDEKGAAVDSFTVGIESFAGAQGRGTRGPSPRKVDDPRGAFRIEKLAPGSYVLTAGTPSRPPSRSDPVTVSGGTTTTGVRIVLPQGGSVVGHVFDERHVPLEGVELRFDAVSSVMESGARARTDGSGQYRLDGAPSGPFTLRAQKDRFRVRMLSGLRVDSRGTLTEDLTLHAVDEANLEFAGIGANLGSTPEGITLSAVLAGGPAERSGLRGDDRILTVDGESVDGMSIADVLQRLRGEPGTTVGVSVRRSKTNETVDVVVERATIAR
jgi:Carboxypeptidase regulatory-like domain/PDZ domain